ncbi:hypothetical protein [Shimia ponticola]|uniref:hypothetical protein n=1 Tax=Shimia ponticola TaxID=2582893 RepID=UPI0011BDDF5E|nr:hypothetical protein [Shimia ponticola]
MPKFLFVYHGGKTPDTPEEGQKAMEAWDAWYTGIGADNVADYGNPVGKSHTVSPSGHTEDGGANPASGYSIISAADHKAACDIAAKNPMVMDGSGSVEVAPIIEM